MDGIEGKARELFHGQAQLYKHVHFWMPSLSVLPSGATFLQGFMRLLSHNGLFSITEVPTMIKKVAYDITSASRLLVSGTNHCLSSRVQGALRPTLGLRCISNGENGFLGRKAH
ncbi:hypothetical protein K1719_012146 [Acacia pycnantha]|nr:hypothetical protein K1719_012146 [Acacia pycnantha]